MIYQNVTEFSWKIDVRISEIKDKYVFPLAPKSIQVTQNSNYRISSKCAIDALFTKTNVDFNTLPRRFCRRRDKILVLRKSVKPFGALQYPNVSSISSESF